MLVSKMLSIDNLDLVIIMYFYLAIIKELCTKTQTLVILLYHVFFSEKSSISNLFVLVLKKIKHRVVETMSSGTADALGLSRAILCNGKFS